MLRAYFDLNLVACPTNCSSTSRHCFLLGTSVIIRPSNKQIVVEYQALIDSTFKLLWFWCLLQDLVSIYLLVLLYTMTIGVLFKLPITVSFMNGPSILRKIVLVCFFSFRAPYSFTQLHFMSSSWAFSQRTIPQVVFVYQLKLVSCNSSWVNGDC